MLSNYTQEAVRDAVRTYSQERLRFRSASFEAAKCQSRQLSRGLSKLRDFDLVLMRPGLG